MPILGMLFSNALLIKNGFWLCDDIDVFWEFVLRWFYLYLAIGGTRKIVIREGKEVTSYRIRCSIDQLWKQNNLLIILV